MKIWAAIERLQKPGFSVSLHHGAPPAIHKHERGTNGGAILEVFQLVERDPGAGEPGYTIREVAAAWALDKCKAMREPIPAAAPKAKTRPSWDIPEWKAIKALSTAYDPLERLRGQVEALPRAPYSPQTIVTEEMGRQHELKPSQRRVPRFD